MIRLIFVALAASAIAQTPAPSFEVASIRPYQQGASRAREITPGSVDARGLRLIDVISWAYGVQDFQVSGPSWINDIRYDISAKAATPAPETEMRGMMQTLLAERFRLTAHKETRQMSALVMTVGKNPHKLVQNDVPGSPSFTTGNLNLTGNGATMKEMTDFISREIRVPIVDQTGLTGRYNYHLDIASYVTEEMRRNPGPPIEASSIVAAAVQEQLGLKVDSGKVPLEVIVVDTMEKAPTEN